MKGAMLSKPARRLLYGIRKARSFTDFAKRVLVDKETLLKMYKGGYVDLGIVRKVEAGLKEWEEQRATPAQVIIKQVADARNVTVERLLSERSRNRYGNYSDGELARYIAIHIIYKETRLPVRSIAAEVGYKNHTSIFDSLKIIGDLLQTNQALRHEVLNLQKSLPI